MRISAITPQKRIKERVNIFIDGKFAFSLPLETVVRERLRIDQQLSEQELTFLLQESELAKWYEKSLNLLSYRPRSIYEIRTYLRRHQVGELVEQTIVDKLQKRKLLDDVAFGKWFVENRIAFRPKSQQALRSELAQKGISREHMEQIFAQSNVPETQLAEKLARKKWSSLASKPMDERVKKLTGYLLRRGFRWEIVSSILASLQGKSID